MNDEAPNRETTQDDAGDESVGHLSVSPCIRMCCLDDQQVCLGCFRAIDEITGWLAAPAAERERILERCAQRRAAHEAALRARLSGDTDAVRVTPRT